MNELKEKRVLKRIRNNKKGYWVICTEPKKLDSIN